jgi:ABC-2 type transport system permease protein
MNVFFRELKSYRYGLLFWCIGMLALVASGMAKFATYSSSGQSITGLLAQFPESVKIIFGLSGFNLDKASGYFGVLFTYMALMATVHAVLLGAGIISKEERDKTSEFLFVKPISRIKVISAKLGAGIVNITALNLVTLASSVYFVNYFTKDMSFNSYILVSMSGLFILQLLFFFVGTVIAAIHKKPKTSASIATSVLLVTFILTFFINLNGKVDWLKYLTPFKYFDAKDMLDRGSLDPLFVVISAVLLAVMIGVTYRSYNSRDLNV